MHVANGLAALGRQESLVGENFPSWARQIDVESQSCSTIRKRCPDDGGRPASGNRVAELAARSKNRRQ